MFYGSSVPDNKAIPAVQYLMSADGGDVKRFVLEGTDYCLSRRSVACFLEVTSRPMPTSPTIRCWSLYNGTLVVESHFFVPTGLMMTSCMSIIDSPVRMMVCSISKKRCWPA